MTEISQSFLAKESAKILLPALLAIFLFVIAIFGIALPTLEKNLIEQKKKKITVLTQTAWNVLNHYQQEVLDGEIDLLRAQHRAKEQIRELRYGPAGKDYFWLTGYFSNLEPEADNNDDWAVQQNYAAIVPVKVDVTNHDALKEISKWNLNGDEEI